MPTLHDVTEKTKKILKWGSIVVALLVFVFLLYRGAIVLKEVLYPTPVDPPTVLFGKLPPVVFPPVKTPQKLSYVVDTVSGKLPTFLDEKKQIRDRMNVYKISHSELTLLDLQNTRLKASSLGFRGAGIQIAGNIYRFQSIGPLPKTLDIDIVDKNFTVTSQFPFNAEVLAAQNLPSPSEAVVDTESFLRSMGTFYPDIDQKKTKVQSLKLKNGILFSAEKPIETQIIRVDYFQKDVGTFPIYYPKGIYSTMYFLVASSQARSSGIVLSNFYHNSPVLDQNATYPIKPVSVAFQELSEGKGYIAANFIKENTIKIQDVFLGYFAGDVRQEYLMPIYVFKGREDEFYAYVSAVSDTYITQAATSEKNK